MTTIVIDGISGSGKSTLLAALQRRLLETRPNYSRLVLSEHFTERWVEGRSHEAAAVEAHVADVLRLAAHLQRLHAQGPFAAQGRILTAFIERLFLTLVSRGLLATEFVARQAELIAAARARSILLVVPEARIEARIATSLTHRSPLWAEYVASLGGLGASAAHFAAQQQRMIATSEVLGRHMPTQVIEVGEGDGFVAPAALDALLPA